MIRRSDPRFHYYSLSPSQDRLVDEICNSLPSGAIRKRFELQVARSLRLAAPLGPVNDELLQRAIDRALAEIGVAAA